MILKGVQFLDYACFTKQFVALDTGVNLIVGKNNAGKTALLKGVAALAALPLAEWPQLSQDLQMFAGSLLEYCRNITPEPYYKVEILFRRRFLISTHSAVFMNSIEANKITHIDAPGKRQY